MNATYTLLQVVKPKTIMHREGAPLRRMRPASEVPLRQLPKTITVPVMNLSQEQVGTIELNRAIFQAPIRTDLISRVVRWQLAKRRAGTAKAKTRAEVRGGGRKPWKQKGTGRARQGSIRAPHWKGQCHILLSVFI